MALAKNTNIVDLLAKAIEDAVQKETSEQYEKRKLELIKQIDLDKDMIVSGIVLNVMKYVSMERRGEELVVTVRKIEK